MVLWSLVVAHLAAGPASAVLPIVVSRTADLVRRIPARDAQALVGSAFVESVRGMNPRRRESAVLQEILRGNVPEFLRQLIPVTLTYMQQGRTLAATVFVMPDYLAIGTDHDFLRIPMNLETATTIGARFGFVLPTRRIVNAINAQADHHFQPQPLPPGPQMSSTEYYRRHNALIEAQARTLGVARGTLVAGHKKDVVVSNLLARTPGRIAIYGWHRLGGAPIQPLSTVHGACYEDYSHGIRLVADVAWQEGTFRPIREILQDPAAAAVLSDEGAMAAIFAPRIQPAATLATFTPGLCSSGIRDGN
jgi:hypothetical protein